MIDFVCGRDAAELGIKTSEGWNITAFLDHVESCDKCRGSREALMSELNKLIGTRESEDRSD